MNVRAKKGTLHGPHMEVPPPPPLSRESVFAVYILVPQYCVNKLYSYCMYVVYYTGATVHHTIDTVKLNMAM